MEEKMFMTCGLESVSSSDQMTVYGGISWEMLRQIVKAIAVIVDFAAEYSDDFIEGFKEGWDSI